MDSDQSEARILVLAPAGRDAALLGNVLSQAGLISAPCSGSGDLHDKLCAGAGAVLLTEEALTAQTTTALLRIIAAQPTWSDLPLVLLVGRARQKLEVLGREANMTVLERPTSISTLMTVMRAALRARRRQYQVRDLLAQEEAMNEQLELQVVARTAELQASYLEIEGEHRHVSAILASISDAFATLDQHDRVTYLNPKGAELAAQLTSRATEDLIGKTVWELFPESEEGSLAQTYQHVVRGGGFLPPPRRSSHRFTPGLSCVSTRPRKGQWSTRKTLPSAKRARRNWCRPFRR
jgi:response regulator RpfG family c-di-GMP phosphodiesterase